MHPCAFLSRRLVFAALGLLALAGHAADERFAFVIPGDDASASVTNLASLSPRAAGADGFVRGQDGHFFTAAGRLRFWGLNTCFAGNFPEKADASKVAAHLAKLGVNAVRMHHHDTAPAPRGIWSAERSVAGRKLSAEQLDRQDFFLHELHRHGIYVNLNLHVGRELGAAEGMIRDGLPYSTRMDKYLLYFMPPMRAALKEFCREYLAHENPYRRLRRTEDPGIALIEITNENSFAKLGPAIAAELPEPYRGEFKRQWNAWLARRYSGTDALRRAWSGGNEPLGDAIAGSGDWRTGPGPWRIKQTAEHKVRPSFGQPGPQPEIPALLLEPGGIAAEVSTQEIQHPNVKLEPGKMYTLTFWARASAPRPLYVDVSNAGPANWNAVGYRETLQLKTDWQRVHRVFRASDDIPGLARVCFKFGGSNVPIALAGLTLRRGGDWVVLPEGQTLENGTIDIPLAGWSEVAHRDARQFMTDTEEAFVREMVDFLKTDLGVRVPITASQISYHPPQIVAATCDYTDIHAYWQHPRFPRKPWDPVDWNLPNTPMERSPDADAMLNRAPWRLLDRPYTMSEWNIPDPHDYAASVVPFAATVAALQDWDGIFFFQYHSGGEGGWYSDRVQRFFSFNGQPVKLALFTAFARAFRNGDLRPLPTTAAGTFDQMLPSSLGFTHRIGIDPKAKNPAKLPLPSGKRLATPDGAVVWDASNQQRAHVTMNTPATRAVWGLVGGGQFTLGGWNLEVGSIDRNYAVLVLTSTDGKPLEASDRALLSAVGSAENVGMKWNESRTSIGNQWGNGPAQVNGIRARMTLPRGGARVYALDGHGQRRREVPAEDAGQRSRFSIGPAYSTLWYEIEW